MAGRRKKSYVLRFTFCGRLRNYVFGVASVGRVGGLFFNEVVFNGKLDQAGQVGEIQLLPDAAAVGVYRSGGDVEEGGDLALQHDPPGLEFREGRLLVADQPGQHLASDVELLQSGKHPGKTNITDADNALNILRYLPDKPCAVIVKHNNPCGAAKADTLVEAGQPVRVVGRDGLHLHVVATDPVRREPASREPTLSA